MGVKGLNSYLQKKSYEEKINVHSTPVIIDGNNLMYHLYFNPKAKDSHLYGGDYPNYGKNLKNFFLKLKLCDIFPIVIFDGVYEQFKIPTVIKRFRENIRDCFKTYTPVLMKIHLLQFLKQQKIFHLQTDYEADKTITQIAATFKLAILSNDTDFLINTNTVRINLNDIKFKNVNNHWRLTSKFTNFKKLMKEFGIRDIRVIALCSFVIGNDVSDCRRLFFNEKRESRIDKIFRHFGGVDYEDGVRFLLQRLGKNVIDTLRVCVKGYVGLDGEEEIVKQVADVIEEQGIVAQNININLNDEMWDRILTEKIEKVQLDDNDDESPAEESTDDEQDDDDDKSNSECESDIEKSQFELEESMKVLGIVDSDKEKKSITLQHRDCTHPCYLKKIQDNHLIFLQPQIELLDTSSHGKSIEIVKQTCSLLNRTAIVYTRNRKKVERLKLEMENSEIQEDLNVYKMYRVDQSFVNQFPPSYRLLVMSLKYYGDCKLALAIFLSYIKSNLKSVNDSCCSTIAECLNGQGKSQFLNDFYAKVENSNYKYDLVTAFKLSEYSCVLFHTIMLFKLTSLYKCPVIENIDLRFVYKFMKYFTGDVSLFKGEPIHTVFLALTNEFLINQ